MRTGWVIAALVLAVGTRAAWAQEQSEDPDKPGGQAADGKDDDEEEPAFSHKGQVGLHLQGVIAQLEILIQF